MKPYEVPDGYHSNTGVPNSGAGETWPAPVASTGTVA